jgi:hypothetical protein
MFAWMNRAPALAVHARTAAGISAAHHRCSSDTVRDRPPQVMIHLLSERAVITTASAARPANFHGRKALREKSNLLNRFNLIWVVQFSSQIYTSSLSPQISGYFRAVPSRQEGRIAIVTNARRDAVDAAASGA